MWNHQTECEKERSDENIVAVSTSVNEEENKSIPRWSQALLDLDWPPLNLEHKGEKSWRRQTSPKSQLKWHYFKGKMLLKNWGNPKFVIHLTADQTSCEETYFYGCDSLFQETTFILSIWDRSPYWAASQMDPYKTLKDRTDVIGKIKKSCEYWTHSLDLLPKGSLRIFRRMISPIMSYTTFAHSKVPMTSLSIITAYIAASWVT